MQQTTSLAFLSAIYSFTVAAAGSLPRGVGPECQFDHEAPHPHHPQLTCFTVASHYQNKNEFACITNTAIKLSLSQVNDNTCDCPDGSDEPGTAACAYIDPLSPEQPLPGSSSGTTNTTHALPGFWCANVGHIGAYVPFSYVNDGVCDHDLCCDGTEEFGHIKCENKCASIGKEYRRLEAEKRGKLERAGKKRKTMATEAQELRRRVEARITTFKSEVAVLEIKKNDLKRKHEELERHERSRVVKGAGTGGGKLGVLVGVAKTRVNELRTTLDGVTRQRDELAGRVQELEAILRKFKEEYNPNFNDEGVKAAVKAFEDYAARDETEAQDYPAASDVLEVLKEDSESTGINWAEFEGADGDDTEVLYNLEAYLPTSLRNTIREKLGQIRLWLVDNGVLADIGKSASESQVVKAAREAAESAEKDLERKNKDLTRELEDLNMDYGPEDILRSVKDKCVSIDSGEYTYELCWLGKTSQKSKKGHGNTNMGNFERIDWETADDEDRLDGRTLGKGQRMVMRYEDGQSCWNGPRRRTDVWLGCAETEELWRVSESEKCVYKMEVGTPAACEPSKEEAGGKDEL